MSSADESTPFPCRICETSLTEVDQFFSIKHAPLSAQQLPSKEIFQQGATFGQICLYACPGCGHYQLSSRPVDYWREVITAAGLSKEMREFRKKQIQSWVRGNRLAGKSVLEVGCGAGYLLDLLSATGVSATGLEYNQELVKQGKLEGRDIRQGYIFDMAQHSEERFDGFICINFLEHAPEPIKFLRSIRSLCKPGAVGIIEVPNFEQDISLSKSHNLIRDHLSYFTSRTLSVVAQLAGFELLRLRECWHGNDLEAIVRVPHRSVVLDWVQGTPTINALAEVFASERGRVALWGASHQALTLLAMLRPTNVICIADSAAFKQGKVDPVCGIPIVSPAELIAASPETVIIIAAGYSQEVKKILVNELGFFGKVVILDELVQAYETPLG